MRNLETDTLTSPLLGALFLGGPGTYRLSDKPHFAPFTSHRLAEVTIWLGRTCLVFWFYGLAYQLCCRGFDPLRAIHLGKPVLVHFLADAVAHMTEYSVNCWRDS